MTFGVLRVLFGAFALVDGAISLIFAIRTNRRRRRRAALALEGVVSAAVGILVFVWPAMSALVLLYVIGAWALLTGVLEIIAAVRLRKEIEGEWLLVLSGLLSVAFGVAVFVWPAGGALAIVWVLGAYAILFGVLFLVLSLTVRRHAPDGAESAAPGGDLP